MQSQLALRLRWAYLGALLMRHWVLRQRAVAAADEAIVAMSPVPPGITSVDILLEEDAEADAQAMI